MSRHGALGLSDLRSAWGPVASSKKTANGRAPLVSWASVRFGARARSPQKLLGIRGTLGLFARHSERLPGRRAPSRGPISPAMGALALAGREHKVQ